MLHEQDLGARVAQDVIDLGAREPPVDRHQHRVALRAGEEDVVVVLRFLAEVADARATAETRGAQRPRRAVALRVELAVADAAAFADDGDLPGLPRGVERHGVGDGLKLGVVHLATSRVFGEAGLKAGLCTNAHAHRFCSTQ